MISAGILAGGPAGGSPPSADQIELEDSSGGFELENSSGVILLEA